MAPYLIALLLLAAQDPVLETPTTEAPAEDSADAPATRADGPLTTAAPARVDAAPPPVIGTGPVAPPKDDYGYAGWCYGALSGYVDLYDKAMPEVERIERAWPTPSTEENIKIIYPGQRAEARALIPELKKAMDLAEQASPTPIQAEGAAAIKKGRAIWTGSTTVPAAQLAQYWMSWEPPGKCEETAKVLAERSAVFGQALSANVEPGSEAVTDPSAEGTVEDGTEVAIAPSAIDDLVPASVEAEPSEAEALDDGAVDMAKPEEPLTDEAPADAAIPEETSELRGPL